MEYSCALISATQTSANSYATFTENHSVNRSSNALLFTKMRLAVNPFFENLNHFRNLT